MAVQLGSAAALAGARFIGFNSTLITDTTPRAIKAAPGANLHYEVTDLIFSNSHATETPTITIDSGTTAILQVILGDIADPSNPVHFHFDPPIVFGSNEAINGEASASTGDVVVNAIGVIVPD